MSNQTLAAHESLDIHEVLNFKTLCLAKSKLMQKDVEQSLQAIAELQAIYKNAPFQAPIPQTRPTPIIN
ncbi:MULTISPECIES: hypothetical protein [Bacillales]|uniref:hypothetical protein n=1 Tax=Bacillales TaxID=1385 RepID=UPI000346E6E6|nr:MULTISPECIES: hypothetical protein [Bacillales]KMZ42816.1 spore gernimation protein GerQ [Bacillus sp. FJAT-27238]